MNKKWMIIVILKMKMTILSIIMILKMYKFLNLKILQMIMKNYHLFVKKKIKIYKKKIQSYKIKKKLYKKKKI